MSEDVGLHVGDIDTVIKMIVEDANGVVDLSTVSTKQLEFEKPGGDTVTKDAVFTTDGTDGAIQYVTVEGDLDRHGTWDCRPFLAFPGGWSGHGSTDSFEVFR